MNYYTNPLMNIAYQNQIAREQNEANHYTEGNGYHAWTNTHYENSRPTYSYSSSNDSYTYYSSYDRD